MVAVATPKREPVTESERQPDRKAQREPECAPEHKSFTIADHGSVCVSNRIAVEVAVDKSQSIAVARTQYFALDDPEREPDVHAHDEATNRVPAARKQPLPNPRPHAMAFALSFGGSDELADFAVSE